MAKIISKRERVKFASDYIAWDYHEVLFANITATVCDSTRTGYDPSSEGWQDKCHDLFEQELIFYLEKFDITEEKVRLKNHLNYFREVMENDFPNGKKLGFISQEIGREINTIGSKANHTELQKIVVQMKDELEKIKEQLLNVL